ncbi:MAG TPA: PDC sensor domain-containing protein, partial [Chloroflexota bacterium]|nr:PDC sensor domain-containing protein [Chloroflexota bacterium]
MLHLSLRAKLLGAFALVLLPVLVLLLVNVEEDQARRENAVLASQLQTARAVANLVDKNFDDNIVLGQVVAEDSVMQSMDPARLDPYLQNLVQRTNYQGNISVYDARGVNRGWGDPTEPATPRLTVAEMPYYQPYFDQTLRSNTATISEVFLLRRPPVVGFVVSVPIRNAQGQPIGAVALTQRTDV